MEKELKCLADAGVICKVTEPTEWCSPVCKQDNSVCICVDLKQLNKAVCRERYTLPSREDGKQVDPS